jgi:hypothetical protein
MQIRGVQEFFFQVAGIIVTTIGCGFLDGFGE